MINGTVQKIEGAGTLDFLKDSLTIIVFLLQFLRPEIIILKEILNEEISIF